MSINGGGVGRGSLPFRPCTPYWGLVDRLAHGSVFPGPIVKVLIGKLALPISRNPLAVALVNEKRSNPGERAGSSPSTQNHQLQMLVKSAPPQNWVA